MSENKTGIFKNKILITALAIVFIVIAGGVTYYLFKNAAGDAQNPVVATVNGKNILKQEIQDIYEYEKANYGITDETDPSQAETVSLLKTNILEQLITEKLVLQKSTEAGFTVTDEILKEAQAEFDNILLTLAQQMKAADTAADAATDNSVYTRQATDYVNSEFEKMGMTKDEYIQLTARNIIFDKFIVQSTQDVQVLDQDIQDYYNSELETQKNQGGPADDSYVELFSPGSVRVKHILVILPEDQQDEYQRLLAEESEEAAKTYLDKCLKAIEPKALEVLDKAKNGGDFESLMAEYGEDPGQDIEQGYIVKQDGQFVKEFEDMSFSLQNPGEISDLVPTPYGYHIIKLYENIPEKSYSLEEKFEELKTAVSETKKMDQWNSLMDKWIDESDIQRFTDKL